MIRMSMRRLSRGRWPKVRPGEHLSCVEVGLLMQRFLDGEIDDEVRVTAIAAHLDVCPPCEHESEVYSQIKAALERGRPPIDPAAVDRLRDFGKRLSNG